MSLSRALIELTKPQLYILLTSALLTLCWRAASSKMSNNHLTGGGKFWGTFKIVPKKSSTNFCTVPFVDNNRVRKISGIDLWDRAMLAAEKVEDYEFENFV